MDLKQIINSYDSDISKFGKKAEYLLSVYNNGKISKEEYQELVNDLLDIQKIEKLAKTAERKALLFEVFNFLRGILLK